MVLLLLFLISALPTHALEICAFQASPNLYFSGTTAICSVSCRSDNVRDEVEATLTLYQGDAYVDSWYNFGTGSVFISGSCKVESGKSYKLVLDYSINGTAQLSETTTGICP